MLLKDIKVSLNKKKYKNLPGNENQNLVECRKKI